MVTIDENAFRTYMFANYLDKLDKTSLLEILEAKMDIESLIGMAQEAWDLPFDLSEGKVKLTDVDALLLRHSEPMEEDCFDCPDRVDLSWEGKESEDIDEDFEEEMYQEYGSLDEPMPYYEDDKYAPYDELDEILEVEDDEKT